MHIESLLLVGAGGHARVVFDALRAAGAELPVVVRDDNLRLEGGQFLDISVRTPVDWVIDGLGVFHVAIGANAVRERCQQQGCQHGMRARVIVHPRGIVSPWARIGDGSFVAAGGVVAPLASVGTGVIVNHGAVVDHDCTVADFVHLAPNSTLGADVTIGRRVLIGAGAIVLPGRRVGDDALVGAGAVVSRDVAPGTTVVGIPARAQLT